MKYKKRIMYGNRVVLDHVYKQRAYDNKWELLGLVSTGPYDTKIDDEEPAEKKWITLNVFDYELEFVE